jgi:hypothetical protein
MTRNCAVISLAVFMEPAAFDLSRRSVSRNQPATRPWRDFGMCKSRRNGVASRTSLVVEDGPPNHARHPAALTSASSRECAPGGPEHKLREQSGNTVQRPTRSLSNIEKATLGSRAKTMRSGHYGSIQHASDGRQGRRGEFQLFARLNFSDKNSSQ